MNERLQLKTYQEEEVYLSDEDAVFLATNVGNKLKVRRAIRGNKYLVDPQQYAGVVALPSGTSLTISPRIPTSNILYMLAIAYRFPPAWLEDLQQFQSLLELLEPIVEFLADLADDRIREGLYRAYVEVEDNAAAIRGRIDFPRDIAYNSVLRHRTYCRYSDLTWDIPENQIIRYTCHMLAGWPFRRADLRRRLLGLDVQLDEISLRPFTPAAVQNLVYQRLNEGYERIHKLCALFLDDASLSESVGTTDFRTFLLDMNALYEQFITQGLIDRAPPGWNVSAQEQGYLDDDKRVTTRPDLVIRYQGNGVLVADCKYKHLETGIDWHNADLYQLFAYCTSLNLKHGLLIYPRHTGPVDDSVVVHHADTRLRRSTVDLRGDINSVRVALDRLGQMIWGSPHEAGVSAA